jgi:uncharacterized protein YqcC (DUF446 family)
VTDSTKIYDQALALAHQIEAELMRLHRWQAEPMPNERFEDMGAFGSKTMSFEQWIQFILLPTIRDIVRERGAFPAESNLSAYAVRYYDGDTSVDGLHDLLSALDNLIEGENDPAQAEALPPETSAPCSPVAAGDKLPDVVYTLVNLLPQYEGDGLESQLQTFDSFLNMLAAEVRPELAALLRNVAIRVERSASRRRIEEAARSIEQGGRAAAPYNHAEAMKKYQQEFKKGYE